MSAFVFLTTAPDAAAGRRIARALVRKRLAACVNVVRHVESFYRWKGRLERSPEVLLVIKAPAKNAGAIEAYLPTVHPYEIPELVALRVSRGLKKYLAWVEQSSR